MSYDDAVIPIAQEALIYKVANTAHFWNKRLASKWAKKKMW
jgi:hypothetical protein